MDLADALEAAVSLRQIAEAIDAGELTASTANRHRIESAALALDELASCAQHPTLPNAHDRQRPMPSTADPAVPTASSSSCWPPASRCAPAALSASNSRSSCADPTCSIRRAPRRLGYTICTAVAPRRGLDVRTYATETDPTSQL
jgi:hypothetical protein